MSHDKQAVVTSHVDAPPERVWTALTDAAELAAWYWPARLRPRAVSDPVVGGGFGIDADGMGFAGRYLELDPPRRLVQSWRWSGDDRDSRVTIELTPAGAGTDVRVVHSEIDEETARMYEAGWSSCLARLTPYAGNR
ncbi:SRPBCC family protein [Actinoplanes sp. NPDC048796]|uniref:SRPBCC family protein n=1 Tax=unclassified Actinoplanes TaxID=2626549 RepID=UPI0033FCB29D